MKKVKKFICDFCKTEFLEESKCKECEKGHAKNLTLEKLRYVRTQKVPVAITVKSEDGVFGGGIGRRKETLGC